MQIEDWIMIVAVFTGPIVAVQLSLFIENRKDKANRRLKIFKNLMATRAQRISPVHVEALNMIDLEFSGNDKKEREVVNAWKSYLDLLTQTSMQSDQLNFKQLELLVDLLHKMSLVLKYEFDKTHIKNSIYLPNAHIAIEHQHNDLRIKLIKVLEGNQEIPIRVTNPPSSHL